MAEMTMDHMLDAALLSVSATSVGFKCILSIE